VVILTPEAIPPYEIPKHTVRAEDPVTGAVPDRCPGLYEYEEQTQFFVLVMIRLSVIDGM
jgi:hypothetical protein